MLFIKIISTNVLVCSENRNMTAAFVKNKLILVDSFGHEIKSNLDIYDIYTHDFNYTVTIRILLIQYEYSIQVEIY